MKKTLTSIGLITGMLVLLCFGACSSTKSSAKTGSKIKKEKAVKAPKQPVVFTSLADRLRRLPGVRVSGDDLNGKVSISGMPVTVGTGNGPLFVIDGVKSGRSLARVSQILNVNDIARINVLRTPAETGFYGVDGANGVLEIKMKKM